MDRVKPIGLLMREHRLIERMVERLRAEQKQAAAGRIDPAFIETAVDFFRTYADRTHHGKEEDILFRELASKALKPEHHRVMEELVAEHVVARRTVRALLEAKTLYVKGDASAAFTVAELLGRLMELYPEHIAKEDKRFFYPVMEYFTGEEQEVMLREFYEFDRNMIHERYGMLAEAASAVSGAMKCSVCGYIYEAARGDPEHGVPAGTRWEMLPAEWVCPVCLAPKSMFLRI